MLSMKTFSEEFAKEVVKEFNEKLPTNDRFTIMESKVEVIEKINDTNYYGIISAVFDKQANKMVPITPTIYLDKYYTEYLNGQTFESLVVECAAWFHEQQYEVPDFFANYDKLSDPDFILDHLSVRLVNAEANKNTLKNAPHVDFLDLTYSFRVICSTTDESVGSYLLQNNLMELNGWDKNTLFDIAKANMERDNPPVIMSLNDKLRQTFGEDLVPPIDPNEPQLYFLSNTDGMNGAACLMYENMIHDFCESKEANIYIIPSSIHEVLVLEADKVDSDFIQQTVMEVNAACVSDSELLSNSVYYYDRHTREFSIAVQGPELNIGHKISQEQERGKSL